MIWYSYETQTFIAQRARFGQLHYHYSRTFRIETRSIAYRPVSIVYRAFYGRRHSSIMSAPAPEEKDSECHQADEQQ